MVVAELLEAVVGWAEMETSIVGVALVGSHARDAARPDSDVDLVVLVRNPQKFLADTAWLEQFGSVVSCETEDWGRVTSLRVFYGEGLEVEFGLTIPDWAELPVDVGTRRVVSDGMRVLYDPEGILKALEKAVGSTPWRARVVPEQ